MDPERSTPGPADLVANLGWVQRLALSLAHSRDAADDLTQEVARVWLERRPEILDPPRGIRAWLAAVTRTLARDRMRSEVARRAREHSVSRPEGQGDTLEIVERGAWQKRATEAVMELPEPYRSTILYRYLDQLPTRTVAARMGVREATVRKRIERGLLMLRARLRGDTDGGNLRGRIAGVLLMITKTKLAGVAIALALLLLLALRILPGWREGEQAGTAGVPDPTTPSEAVQQNGSPKPDVIAEPVVDARRVEGESAAAPPAPTTGALLLHVVWGDDQKPAPGVLLSLYRAGADPLFDEPSGTSDGQGSIRFVGLQPGRVHPQVERGEQDWDEAIEIVAGRETESTVEVGVGMDCEGIVLDGEERPIPDAEVLVSGWGGGLAFPLTRTGPDGTFTLGDVSTHCYIGARAPGYAASPLRQFTAGKGATVKLRIVLDERAAELSGVVLGPHGRPVEDAVVQAGKETLQLEKRDDGTFVKSPKPVRARTDAQGRFAIQSLLPGSVPLQVRARGLSPWSQPVELRAGASNSVTVQLEAGVTLLGIVRDAWGAAVPRASIQLGKWDELSNRSALTDAQGGFRIEGAGTGELGVRAEREGQGTADATLHAVAGETVRWDAVLSNGTVLRGLVLDAEDEPVKNAMVEARQTQRNPDVPWSGFENTDDAGRFALKNCVVGQPLRITVRRKTLFPEVILPQVGVSDEELVIRMPREAWVHIQGRVLDPEESVLPNVHVSPSMKGGSGSPAESVDPSTGAFRCGPYPPGEYRLHVQADGYPAIRLPERVLGPDEVWDVGTLRLQRGGSLLLNVLDASPGSPPCWLSILDPSGEYLDNVKLQDGVGRAGPFAPGGYVLQIAGEDVACRQQPVEVQVGVELRVDVQVQPGIRVEIEFQLTEDTPAEEGVRVVITDASGQVVIRSTAWRPKGPPRMSVGMLPGSYRVEASKDALRGSGSFTVVAGEKPAPVSVPLTPP